MDVDRSRSLPRPYHRVWFRRTSTRRTAAILLFAGACAGVAFGQAASATQAAPPHPVAAKLSAEQIASLYYPPEMVDPEGKAGGKYCATSSEVAANGSPGTVFAVYPWGPAGNPGEIWVFRRQATGDYRGSRVGDSKLVLSSDYCNISVTDAGQPTGKVLEVALCGNGDCSSFLFRWDGVQLTTIGPVDQSPDSDMLGPAADTWGLIPIFSGNAPGLNVYETDPNDGSNEEAIYRFDGRQYVFHSRAAYAGVFRCVAAACDATCETFKVTRRMTGPFVLRVANGELSGKGRVPAATAAINGVVIGNLAAASSGSRVTVFPLPKVALGTNQITIRPEPIPDGAIHTIYVVVEDHTKRE